MQLRLSDIKTAIKLMLLYFCCIFFSVKTDQNSQTESLSTADAITRPLQFSLFMLAYLL